DPTTLHETLRKLNRTVSRSHETVAVAFGAPPAPLRIDQLLEMGNASTQQGAVKDWVQRMRVVSFAVPAQCSMVAPLAIADAASGANLASFREVMDFDSLVASFPRVEEYEAAGAAWMLDPVCADIDDVTVSQLEGAMSIWSEETFLLSSKHAPSRRLTFDVPLPALVVDAQAAQRLEPGKPGVRLAEPLAMIAGRAAAITWCSAMGEALKESNEDRVWHLFNAALSAPIRTRALPDAGATHLAALSFGEKLFTASAASGADSFWQFAGKACRVTSVRASLAKSEAVAKLEAALKAYGLQFKGKPRAAATAAALKGLRTFVLDSACASAFSLAEAYIPELREPALLMGIGFACSKRAVSDDDKAKELFVFILDTFRVARLAGDVPNGEKLAVSRACGRDCKSPGMPHALFKQKELVEYMFHEASLMHKEHGRDMAAFKTPLRILQRFASSGADGPAASHRVSDSGGGADGMEILLALPVAECRKTVDCKSKAMIDVARPLWAGAFDEGIVELAEQGMQSSAPAFVWHTYLAETSQEVGAKYRAFVAACMGGPTPADPELDANLVGQMQSVWGALSHGHRFARKKTDVRAFVLSAELFPPNVAKQGAKARLCEQLACDEAKFKRVIEFFLQKRQTDDILIFFDGRSRANRRAIETVEAKLESGGPRAFVECWIVREQPNKKEDPRSLARAHSYTKNNRETAIFSLPVKGPRKVVHRLEFNARGESSTADATYTGATMRRLSELPRLSYETKASILGAASCASVDGANSKKPRLQADVDSKGHPFSHSEVKPISLWQTIMGHHNVTHIVDFTPGSGALAVAAAGAMEYEGVACNDNHRDWLDFIVDRCAMHKAGHEEGRAHQLGGDADFAERASKYFSGTMMEAKRLLMPLVDEVLLVFVPLLATLASDASLEQVRSLAMALEDAEYCNTVLSVFDHAMITEGDMAAMPQQQEEAPIISYEQAVQSREGVTEAISSRRKQLCVMAEVLRVETREVLRNATSISLSLGESKYRKIFRYRADVPAPVGGGVAHNVGASGYCRSGVLGILDCRKSRAAEFEEGHAAFAVEQLGSFFAKFCAPLGRGRRKALPLARDESLKSRVLATVTSIAADGAAKERRAVFLAARELSPNLLIVIRGPAHAMRIASRPLHCDDAFGEVRGELFDGRHALAPDIMNSDKWRDLFVAIQEDDIAPVAQAGLGRKPLEAVVRNLSFAKQRFDSTAGPAGKIALMLLPVATSLAHVSSDRRRESEKRERALNSLRKFDTKFCMAVGVSADWGIICNCFLRLFDVANRGIASSRLQIDCMVETLGAVFKDGRAFQTLRQAAPGAAAAMQAASGAAAASAEPLPCVGEHGEAPGFIATAVMSNLRRKYIFLADGNPVLPWGDPRDAHKAELLERVQNAACLTKDRLLADFPQNDIRSALSMFDRRLIRKGFGDLPSLQTRRFILRGVGTVAAALSCDEVAAQLQYRDVIPFMLGQLSAGKSLAEKTNQGRKKDAPCAALVSAFSLLPARPRSASARAPSAALHPGAGADRSTRWKDASQKFHDRSAGNIPGVTQVAVPAASGAIGDLRLRGSREAKGARRCAGVSLVVVRGLAALHDAAALAADADVAVSFLCVVALGLDVVASAQLSAVSYAPGRLLPSLCIRHARACEGKAELFVEERLGVERPSARGALRRIERAPAGEIVVGAAGAPASGGASSGRLLGAVNWALSVRKTWNEVGPEVLSVDGARLRTWGDGRNCRFLDNDNYQVWPRALHNPQQRAWLESNQEKLHMKCYFDSLGFFETLDGNSAVISTMQGASDAGGR
ncbi:unnamed protein product, partial [Prorocentrum cordatum]